MNQKEINQKIERIEKELAELKAECNKKPSVESFKKEIIDIVSKYNFHKPVEFEGTSLKIALPTANKLMTFAVWNCVKEICTKYPKAYPTHYSGTTPSEYQYVEFKYVFLKLERGE